MKTTIDQAGRLVIPSEVRREAALQPGVPLDVRCRDGVIEIEPLPLPLRFKRRGRFLVAVPKVELPPLTTATVTRTLRRIRGRRGR